MQKSLALALALTVCTVTETLASASEAKSAAGHRENPIRKVVNMLQMMDAKIRAEGEKAKELYDKFMCYCENADTILGAGIADSEHRVPQLEAAIEAAIALKGQLELEVKWHQKDRAEAQAAIKVALGIKTKCVTEAEVKINEELMANILALKKAIAALEKGTYGTFLQTSAASTLRKLSISMDDLSEVDRNMLASFLTSNQPSGHYVPQSQEIIGILKQMLDEMMADLKDAKAGLKQCNTDYNVVLELNMKRISASEDAIEGKLKRIGELGVKIAMLKNDLEDTTEGLAEDRAFLRDLEKNCAAKKKEWVLYKKMQAEELLALADTIKVLNDDDTLELLKKTLPSGAASLVQVQVSTAGMRRRALSMLRAARNKGESMSDARFDFLELALTGQKVSFDKIIKMIDELVVQLGKEQVDDDAKKEYCDTQLDIADDEKKALDHKISDLEIEIEDIKESITTLKSEIDALEDGIRALDKQVSEATEQRKQEHADYVEELAGKSAAKDILAFAMNRLNKFYNPKLYNPPPKRELTEAERITVNNGGTLAPTEPPAGIAGTGITIFAQVVEHKREPVVTESETTVTYTASVSAESSAEASWEAPEGFEAGASANMKEVHVDEAAERKEVKPPPSADLSYKKGGASGGVIEMIKLLISDLEKDIVEMETDEKDAQEDYEQFMRDSAEKRAKDSKALTDKEGYLAEAETELLDDQEALKSNKHKLMGLEKYIMELHQECDFLIKYYSIRKEARAGEIESLKNAKDVLAGANL